MDGGLCAVRIPAGEVDLRLDHFTFGLGQSLAAVGRGFEKPAALGGHHRHQNVDETHQQRAEHPRAHGAFGHLAGLGDPQPADGVQRLPHRRIAFGVDIDAVRSRLGKGLYQPMGILHHQVHVKGQLRQRAQPLYHRRPEAKVGHENPIHHIQVQHIRAGTVDKSDFLCQTGEIAGENRG